MAKGVHGGKHLADKMMPGHVRKHTNLKAHQDGLSAGLRLHQGYARSGAVKDEEKGETKPDAEMFE